MAENRSESDIIEITNAWIEKFVIAHNFCPFAQQPYTKKSISYVVDYSEEPETNLKVLFNEFLHLDENDTTDTSFIIYPLQFQLFQDYLNFHDISVGLLEKMEYEGVYQIASFHPLYIFQDSDENDPANYTNRSPFPMLHILREDQVEKARTTHKNVDQIPVKNIKLSRKLGLKYFQDLFKSLFSKDII